MKESAFDSLLDDFNPSHEHQFQMPYSEACRYFPLNEKSLTSLYPFGGTANNIELKATALENGWVANMLNDAIYSYDFRKIGFKRR